MGLGYNFFYSLRRGVIGMRRGIGLMLAVLLCVVLLILPILAQDEIYFTAINNTILELQDETMPTKHKGMYYVPCSVFNSTALKTYSLYSRSKQMAMISDLDRTLYFDMSAGSCYDDNEETYPYVAIYHNDTAYVPALFTADYFGIEYDYLLSDYAPIIRLTKGDVLSEELFLRGAAAILSSRLSQYVAEHTTAAPTEPPAVTEAPVEPTETPVPTPRPTETPPPSVTPEPTASPRPIRSGVTVYIAVLGLGDDSEAIADMLLEKEYVPCFFLRSEEIRSKPDTVRELLGKGCGIGILFSESPLDEYGEASALLREAARTYTFMCAFASRPSAEVLEAAEQTGLRVWSAEAPENDLITLQDKLDTAADRCDILLDGGISLSTAARLAEYLQADSYGVKMITELTTTALEQKELVK